MGGKERRIFISCSVKDIWGLLNVDSCFSFHFTCSVYIYNSPRLLWFLFIYLYHKQVCACSLQKNAFSFLLVALYYLHLTSRTSINRIISEIIILNSSPGRKACAVSNICLLFIKPCLYCFMIRLKIFVSRSCNCCFRTNNDKASFAHWQLYFKSESWSCLWL